jgi:formate dehydrogenase major subunit
VRAALTGRIARGVVYTTFHFPESGVNLVTTENSDWATNCPEYKVTAVEVAKVTQPDAWRERARAMRTTRKGASVAVG